MDILKRFDGKINGVLETFDRIIINGYIQPFHNFRLFLYYLIQKNVLLKDFDSFARQQTDTLCSHIETYIRDNDSTLTYLNSGQIDKGELARQTYLQKPDKEGLICAFSTVEPCKTITVKPNRESKKLEVTSKLTKCKHYYLYYNDTEFGWMFFKIQTWLPYNVQVYLNGREYLSRLLDEEGIAYSMYNNSFSYIEDFSKAQVLADRVLNKKLSDSFDGIAKKVNCLLSDIQDVLSHSYYWCVDQCEFVTDINFKSREELGFFYKTLVETVYFTFSSEDIYSFFGRNVEKIHTFRKGEIVSDLRHRCQGYRIKFKINQNQIKMYDKGNNLRIEVTINNPRDFKVLKTTEKPQDGEMIQVKTWVPMGKSITNLYRYVEISKAIIIVYADDFVCCFQYREEAEEFYERLKRRMKHFGLELEETKSRLIEFGRYAGERQGKEGKKPETFAFLGFTHYCSQSRNGKFRVKRKTNKKKFAKKCREVHREIAQMRILPLPMIIKKLN